ncbi:HAD hydrolase-like protein, partial [archaeon]|nr:HAD hydrolase-like protein [archaeon]
KLESVDLWKHFKLGAYGNVARVRSELVEVALTEAKKTTGISFDKNDVFIVGDTPLDIECAKHGGVKSVAIATGQKSLKELNQNMPDYAFEDFSDIESMLKIFT